VRAQRTIVAHGEARRRSGNSAPSSGNVRAAARPIATPPATTSALPAASSGGTARRAGAVRPTSGRGSIGSRRATDRLSLR
jgi:hypothetical protein